MTTTSTRCQWNSGTDIHTGWSEWWNILFHPTGPLTTIALMDEMGAF
ncbi:MAG TPA: hypothetical protein VGC02_01435 [Methanobacterium sp.]